MSLERHEIAWTVDAKCADQPSDVFHPVYNNRHDEALDCCNHTPPCPVRRHCLAYAIANDEHYGIWGGMTHDEIARLAHVGCSTCFWSPGRRAVAEMILSGTQHTRCPHCDTWVEVVPTWEHPHRNSYIINGPGRRT